MESKKESERGGQKKRVKERQKQFWLSDEEQARSRSRAQVQCGLSAWNSKLWIRWRCRINAITWSRADDFFFFFFLNFISLNHAIKCRTLAVRLEALSLRLNSFYRNVLIETDWLSDFDFGLDDSIGMKYYGYYPLDRLPVTDSFSLNLRLCAHPTDWFTNS